MNTREITITISAEDIQSYLNCSDERACGLWDELMTTTKVEEIIEEDAMYTFNNLVTRLIGTHGPDHRGCGTSM